jgi:uncharacterized membrane protein
MKVASETHLRTTAKVVVYRSISLTTTILLTIAYGATITQAMAFGVYALLSGLAMLYVYDRIWLLIGWNRDSRGEDTNKRSIVKAILYRCIVMLMVMAGSLVIFTSSSWTAFLMATSQFVLNITTFYVCERVWNKIKWGKITN